MVKILVKKGGMLNLLGEGNVFSKKDLLLREGIDANIGSARSVRDAQLAARKVMNQNPSVTTASIEAGKADGQNDYNSGEGMKTMVPINASGSEIANAQRLASQQSNDDMEISFYDPNKQKSNSDSSALGENRIRFTKQELNKFLRNI